MVILVTIKYPSIPKIRARLRSHAPMEHMPIDECRLGYVTHLRHSKDDDVHFLRHDRRNYGSFHGRLLGLWDDLRSLSRKFRQSLAEMPREGPDPQLGEMSVHGP